MRDGLTNLLADLDREGAEGAIAVMVDCYPARLPLDPASASPIPWRRAPFFDPGPYLSIPGGSGRARFRYGGVRQRLFWPHWKYVRRLRQFLPKPLRGWLGSGPPFVRKLPLLRNVPRLDFRSIHESRGIRVAGEMFALLHYKLDLDLDAKVASALRERQYADHSRDYEAYARIAGGAPLRIRNGESVVFRGALDLEKAKLLTSARSLQRKQPRSAVAVSTDEAEGEIWGFGDVSMQNALWLARFDQEGSPRPLSESAPGRS
jgi:hypothetical protein